MIPLHQQLIASIYTSEDRADGPKRTEALRQAFKKSLFNPALENYRPDEIWTNLQTQYYRVELCATLDDFQSCRISPEKLIDKCYSVRNGWVKSSGTAFENFIESHYDPIFQSLETGPRVRLIKKANITPFNATNFNQHELGSHKVDDLYLLVKIHAHWVIWAMISAQASGGDRWERGAHRCNALRSNGINCINLTLDPRDVPRSPNGMLCLPSYLSKFQCANPCFNAHFILDSQDCTVPILDNVIQENNLQMPGRIFKTNLRAVPDLFVTKACAMAQSFVQQTNQLNSAANW